MYSRIQFLNYLKINQRIDLFLSRPFQTNFKVSRLQFIIFQNYASVKRFSSSLVSANASKKKPKTSRKNLKQNTEDPVKEDKDKKFKKSRRKKEPLLSTEKVDEISNNLLQDLCQNKTLSEKFSLKPPTITENINDIIESYKPKKDSLTNLEFQELINKMNKAFIVTQLKTFLKNRNLDSNLKKEKLIEKLISEAWKIEKKTKEHCNF